jgi:hypothetical protein
MVAAFPSLVKMKDATPFGAPKLLCLKIGVHYTLIPFSK